MIYRYQVKFLERLSLKPDISIDHEYLASNRDKIEMTSFRDQNQDRKRRFEMQCDQNNLKLISTF